MHEAWLYDDYQTKGHRRPGDPHLRVKELDRDGVDAEVIYGILAACAKMKNPAAANEQLRAEVEQRAAVERQRGDLLKRVVSSQEDERRRIAE